MAKAIPPLPRDMRNTILPGHAACHGCPIPIALKVIGAALGKNTILVVPASCTSIVVGAWPGCGFNGSVIHVAFASAAAVASGIAETLSRRGIKDVHVVAWAGDGGTADIGMASLSGAAERNHDFIYIMYDNEAYMNTGIQRSSATLSGAWTTTTPLGKREAKKDVARIMIAHGVPYVATASVGYPHDFYAKLKKASKIRGFKFIQLHAPCPTGWRFDPSLTVKIAKLAVETGLWILYEYENNKIKLSGPSRPYIDKNRRKPIIEYLKLQGRFKNITEEHVRAIEQYIDNAWDWIRRHM